MSDSPLAEARVMVLGARGFMGRAVVRALSAAGARPIAVSRSGPATDETFDEVSSVVAELADPSAFPELLARWEPHAVVNAIGYGVDPLERDEAIAARINTGLPPLLAERLAAAALPAWNGVRLVHLGSALEYGQLSGDLEESRPPRPSEFYGRSKLAGTEALARAAAASMLPAVTARLFTVFGSGELPGRLLPGLLSARHRSGRIPLTRGEQRRDFTWVGDAAEGICRLLAASVTPGDVVNLATGQLTTVREFVERAAAVLGIDPSRLDFGALPTRAEEIPASSVSVAKLTSLLRWRPSTSIEEGVRRTVDAEDVMR